MPGVWTISVMRTPKLSSMTTTSPLAIHLPLTNKSTWSPASLSSTTREPLEKAMMSFDVFGHEDRVGKRVVIIGGGAIGVELAIHLNGLGHESTIVEMTEHIAAKAQLTERTDYLTWLEKSGVKTLVDTACTEITDRGVRVKNADGEQFLEADTVIIAAGTRALEKERDQFADVAFDVISVGDCVKASSIVHATHTGFDAGLTL